ncbi:unnamed protein product [Clonostachys byssicola]|uniref:LCCL domain-containing protein n=1 Tax=Clonostachys byssicola TaxID=160290 RepID=A0A9N9Y8L8_9HYPO|nr:unnamed protein product [Clonostachys byssicola]
MAAPAEKTLKNLTGKWSLNKTLSGSTDALLALQGIGYLTRKGIGLASVTLDVNEYEAAPKPPNAATEIFTHIDIEQTAAGLSSTHERRCVDDTWREHEDWLFGKVKGRTRWVALAEVDDEFLKTGWEEEKVGEDGKNLILSEVESVGNGWTATQIWGFQKIDGERRYVRHVVVKKEDKTEVVKLVYDYTGQ